MFGDFLIAIIMYTIAISFFGYLIAVILKYFFNLYYKGKYATIFLLDSKGNTLEVKSIHNNDELEIYIDHARRVYNVKSVRKQYKLESIKVTITIYV